MFVSLVCSIALPMHAQAPQNDLPFIKRHYRNFMADLKVIKKCYFSKSTCDQEEKQQAQRAVKRLGVRGAALIGALTAMTAIGFSGVPGKSKRRLHSYLARLERKWRGEKSTLVSELDFRLIAMISQNDYGVSAAFHKDEFTIIWFDVYSRTRNKQCATDVVKDTVAQYNKSRPGKEPPIIIINEYSESYELEKKTTFLWKNNQWKKIGR